MSKPAKTLKEHLASIAVLIWRKTITLITFGYKKADQKLTENDIFSRQVFSGISNREWLYSFFKILSIVVFVGILLFLSFYKRPASLSIQAKLKDVNKEVARPSRLVATTSDTLEEFNINTTSQYSSPVSDSSETPIDTGPKVPTLDAKDFLKDNLSDEDVKRLKEALDSGKVPGTSKQNAIRASLIGDPAPPVEIKDMLKSALVSDTEPDSTLAEKYVMGSAMERRIVETILDPKTDPRLANLSLKYLLKELEAQDEEKFNIMRTNWPDDLTPLRDLALLLSFDEDEEKRQLAQDILRYLREQTFKNRDDMRKGLQKYARNLDDILFNSNYPPNRLYRIDQKVLDELRQYKGDLRDKNFPNEDEIFSKVLDRVKIDLDAHDLLRDASHKTKASNKIYNELFHTKQGDKIDLNHENKKKLAALALNAPDDIRSLIERLLAGEELSEEEMLKLKQYLYDTDPELFRKLFGEHAYKLMQLKNLLKDPEIREALSDAIKKAREAGFYREAELLDKLLKGEDLTEEELEAVKKYLMANDPDLAKKLFGDTNYYIDSSGRRLSATELAALQKIRANDSFLNKKRLSFFEGTAFSTYQSTSGALATLGEHHFTSAQGFKALLNSQIYLSDQEKSISYRYHIVLYDDLIAATGKLIAPKGSVIIGTTSASDVNFDTGVISLTTNTVALADRDINISFDVSSGNGLMAVKGETWDYKEKKWIGLTAVSLVAGLSDVTSQVIQRDYAYNENKATIPLAMPSILLGGVAETLSKIGEEFSKDLQQAPRFFRLNRGLPVILYPKGKTVSQEMLGGK